MANNPVPLRYAASHAFLESVKLFLGWGVRVGDYGVNWRALRDASCPVAIRSQWFVERENE